MNSISGIYKIVNIINNHKYIGSAKNLERRKREHFIALRKGKHHSLYLQRAYNKYGEFCFLFQVVMVCNTNDLIKNEQVFIDREKPEYNILKKAGSLIGFKHTEESKIKMSDSAKGRTFTDEFKEKMRILFTGKKRDKSIGEKISKTNKGRVFTEAWKNKIRIANTGKKHTEEQTNKIRAAHIGRKNTPEAKERMRQAAYKRIQRQMEQDE